MVGVDVAAAESDTLAAISTRLLVTSHWSDPLIARKCRCDSVSSCVFSESFGGLVYVSLLSSFVYSSWSIMILWSGCCR